MHKGTIFYINPLNQATIRYYGAEFIDSEIKNPKKLFIGSRILYQDMILHSIKAHENDLKHNLDTFVEMKMYEEIGLDLNKKYKIGYIVKKIKEEDSYIIDAYAIEIDKLQERFSKIVEKSKHIDFLAIPFLSYKALYENKILEKENDIFITIYEDEAFAVFYKQGEYISSKSLPTLKEILKDIKNISPEVEIDLKSLKKTLFEKGLKESLYEPPEYPLYRALIEIFSKIFTKISNIAVHNRNIYGFERIDRIFFSVEDKTIRGAKELLNLFSKENEIMLYKHSFFKTKKDFSQLDLITAVYIYHKAKNSDENENITIFAKKPSFLKSESGKFIAFLAACIIILSAYPIYKEYQIVNLQKKYELLSQKYEEMQNSTFLTKQRIEELKREIKSIDKEVKIRQDRIAQIEKIVNDISNHLPNKRAYTQMIAEIDALLEKYRLQVKEIRQKNRNEITLKIVSKEEKRDTIAKFMGDLLKEKGFSDVETDEIKLDKDAYTSLIKIER